MCSAGWLLTGSSVGEWQEQGCIPGSEQGLAGGMDGSGGDGAGGSCTEQSSKAHLAGKKNLGESSGRDPAP